jgi:holo-[acyl-carrier protein] synthase
VIRGIGTDLASVEELRRELGRNPGLRAALFTPGELASCASDADPIVRLAARFAAKEAVMKALGTGWGSGVDWHDVEVKDDPGGPPRVHLSGEALRLAGSSRVWLSMSHEGGYALAFVVIEQA